jgi:hypothetical protein
MEDLDLRGATELNAEISANAQLKTELEHSLKTRNLEINRLQAQLLTAESETQQFKSQLAGQETASNFAVTDANPGTMASAAKQHDAFQDSEIFVNVVIRIVTGHTPRLTIHFWHCRGCPSFSRRYSQVALTLMRVVQVGFTFAKHAEESAATPATGVFFVVQFYHFGAVRTQTAKLDPVQTTSPSTTGVSHLLSKKNGPTGQEPGLGLSFFINGELDPQHLSAYLQDGCGPSYSTRIFCMMTHSAFDLQWLCTHRNVGRGSARAAWHSPPAAEAAATRRARARRGFPCR